MNRLKSMARRQRQVLLGARNAASPSQSEASGSAGIGFRTRAACGAVLAIGLVLVAVAPAQADTFAVTCNAAFFSSNDPIGGPDNPTKASGVVHTFSFDDTVALSGAAIGCSTVPGGGTVCSGNTGPLESSKSVLTSSGGVQTLIHDGRRPTFVESPENTSGYYAFLNAVTIQQFRRDPGRWRQRCQLV